MTRKRALIIGAGVAGVLAVAAGIAFVVLGRTPQVGVETVPVAEQTETAPVDTKPLWKPEALPWPAFGRDPARRSDASDLDFAVPGKALWARNLTRLVEFPPAVGGGAVYVNVNRRGTYALNPKSGRVWWFRRNVARSASSPALDGQRVFVATFDRYLRALRRDNGHLLWSFRTAGPMESSPVAVDGTVYVGSSDHRVYALDATTGRLRWAFRTGGAVKGAPVVTGGRVYTASYDGGVYALRADTGRLVWRRYFYRLPRIFDSFYASPAVADGRIVIASRSGKVHGLQASDGRTLWTRTIGGQGYATAAFSEGTAIVGSYNGTLMALDTRSGGVRWRIKERAAVGGTPVVIGRYVYYSTFAARTAARRVRDGKLVWGIAHGRYVPASAGPTRFYFSLGKRVIAFIPRGADESDLRRLRSRRAQLRSRQDRPRRAAAAPRRSNRQPARPSAPRRSRP